MPGRREIVRHFSVERVGRIRSASRLVEMYRVGSIGAPEEAEIYRKVGTL